MIENHFGKPGSGKSYSVMANVILPALKSGSRVLTNIDGASDKGCRLRLGAALNLSEAELGERYIALSEEEIITGACWGYVQARDVYVIDEVQRYWPGGVLKPSDPLAFRFFGEHRHYGCHIHCITINPNNYQSPMRAYAEVSHLYKKLGFLGLNSRFICRDFASAVPGKDCQVSSKTAKYKKEIFSYYKSVTEDGNNIVGKQKNILLQPKILAALILVPLALGFSFYRIHKNGVLPYQARDLEKDRAAKLLQQQESGQQQQEQRPFRRRASFFDDGEKEITSYTGYGCLDENVCYLRFSDGSIELVRAARLPGGLVYSDGRVYLPGARQ